jgi:hypothetical protein
MGVFRGALVLATVAACLTAACSFGIDTAGLAADGASAPEAASHDGPADSRRPSDAGPDDGRASDSSRSDSGRADSGPRESGPTDSTTDSDSRPSDTGPADSPHDTGPTDSRREDTAPEDTTFADSRPEDTGPEDTGPEDHGSDTEGVDSGPADSGVDVGVDAPSDGGSCNITAVQAVPGTGTYHVITDGGTNQQGIAETAGDLLVAILYAGQNPYSSAPLTTTPNMNLSVTDTLGNTYYAAPMYENTISNQAVVQIFYAPNIAGGYNVVTGMASTGLGMVQTGLFLQEYSGLATSDVVDVSSGQTAPPSTTVIEPLPMTTTASCDLVVGAFSDGHVDAQAINASGGWILRSSDRWDPAGAVDDAPIGVPAGSIVQAEMDLTTSPDNGWAAAQVAFRAATTTALPQPNQISFLSTPQSVMHGTCSSAVTLDSTLAAAPTRTATGVDVSLSAPDLTFYIDPACTYPIKSVLIGAGTDSQSFYFIGPTGGGQTITASAGFLGNATQNETLY